MFDLMLRRVLSVLILAVLFLPAAALGKTRYQPLPVRLDHDGEKWADKTLRKLSVEEKVGQLFMIWTRAEFLNAASPDYAHLRHHESVSCGVVCDDGAL